jgi:hypothetical protein
MERTRQRDEPALRNRLRTPRDALAAVQHLTNERMCLELLQQVVHGQLHIAVVEPDDHA